MTDSIDVQMEEFHERITNSLYSLDVVADRLFDIAEKVSYLHPDMANELEKVSFDIQSHTNMIRKTRSDSVNASIKEHQKFLGGIIDKMVKK